MDIANTAAKQKRKWGGIRAKKEKIMTVSFTAWYYTVLNTFRLHWPEWVQIQ
jgi:hypothetical protein